MGKEEDDEEVRIRQQINDKDARNNNESEMERFLQTTKHNSSLSSYRRRRSLRLGHQKLLFVLIVIFVTVIIVIGGGMMFSTKALPFVLVNKLSLSKHTTTTTAAVKCSANTTTTRIQNDNNHYENHVQIHLPQNNAQNHFGEAYANLETRTFQQPQPQPPLQEPLFFCDSAWHDSSSSSSYHHHYYDDDELPSQKKKKAWHNILCNGTRKSLDEKEENDATGSAHENTVTQKDSVAMLRSMVENITASNNISIIFYHFPKTGGESLEYLLNLQKSHKTALQREHELRELDSNNNNNNADAITIAITILRNPYDRLLSWFRFCLHGWRRRLPSPHAHCQLAHQLIAQHEPPQPEWQDDNVTSTTMITSTNLKVTISTNTTHNITTVAKAFEEWLEIMFVRQHYRNPDDPSKQDPSMQYYYYAHSWLTMPQTYFLGGPHKLYDTLDYYIRFEHYAHDVAYLLRTLQRYHNLLQLKSQRHDEDGMQDDDEKVEKEDEKKDYADWESLQRTIASVRHNDNDNDNHILKWPNRWNVGPYNPHVAHILRTSSRHDLYTRAARQLVELWFANDLHTFNYSFAI